MKLNCFVENRPIKLKRRTHQVPFPITSNRRFHLIVKWVSQTVKKDTRKISIYKKLALELLEILNFKNPKTIEKKKINLNQAILNRANLHYRW